MRERNGNSKCVGFARIEDNDVCEEIVQELNGKLFPGRNKILFLKAQSKLICDNIFYFFLF
jgi:hypothetical protein